MLIIFPWSCAVYMYKIMILLNNSSEPLCQFPLNFTLILLIENLFKWSSSIDCHVHIVFFNYLTDDPFISCNDRIRKMLHNICISVKWVGHGPWASCFLFFFFSSKEHKLWSDWTDVQAALSPHLFLSIWILIAAPAKLLKVNLKRNYILSNLFCYSLIFFKFCIYTQYWYILTPYLYFP